MQDIPNINSRLTSLPNTRGKRVVCFFFLVTSPRSDPQWTMLGHISMAEPSTVARKIE